MCWCVQSLVTLEQGGSISLNSLETQLETVLEGVVTFNPPGEPSSSTIKRKEMFVCFFLYHPSCITSSLFLSRDRFGAEAHGVLQPVQRRPGLAEWSGCVDRRGARCSRNHLAGPEGEGLPYSASSHSLLSLSCISTTHDAHHGGVHYSTLQPW